MFEKRIKLAKGANISRETVVFNSVVVKRLKVSYLANLLNKYVVGCAHRGDKFAVCLFANRKSSERTMNFVQLSLTREISQIFLSLSVYISLLYFCQRRSLWKSNDTDLN